jgi:hypothetical protein
LACPFWCSPHVDKPRIIQILKSGARNAGAIGVNKLAVGYKYVPVDKACAARHEFEGCRARGETKP